MMNNCMTESTPRSILFTLTTMIAGTRAILTEDFGMSEERANTAILLAVDAEKRAWSGERDGR